MTLWKEEDVLLLLVPFLSDLLACYVVFNFKRPKPNLPSFEEIRRAVPSSCFERSLFKSLLYLVLDFMILYGLYKFVGVFESFGIFGLFIW